MDDLRKVLMTRLVFYRALRSSAFQSGNRLHFATGKNMVPEQNCHRCAGYKSNTGDCAMHCIREEMIKLFVLRRIFDVTEMFTDNADDFRRVIQKQRFEKTEKTVKRRKKELEHTKQRIAEPDRIFKRIHEDGISGTISHERFLKLSAGYEAEQKELVKYVKAKQTAVDTCGQDRAGFNSFAAIIRKYVGIEELTPAVVNGFIYKIIVQVPDKSSGHPGKKSKSFGASSGSRAGTHKLLNGKEKAEQHGEPLCCLQI